jgi:hypothetical protein
VGYRFADHIIDPILPGRQISVKALQNNGLSTKLNSIYPMLDERNLDKIDFYTCYRKMLGRILSGFTYSGLTLKGYSIKKAGRFTNALWQPGFCASQ